MSNSTYTFFFFFFLESLAQNPLSIEISGGFICRAGQCFPQVCITGGYMEVQVSGDEVTVDFPAAVPI